jgi:hypothetical protein
MPLARAAEWLSHSTAVTHGTGYGPNKSVPRDHRGAPVPLQLGRGGLVFDTFGRPLDVNGDAVRGMFTFGLGSGFPSGGHFGSEAAFADAFTACGSFTVILAARCCKAR